MHIAGYVGLGFAVVLATSITENIALAVGVVTLIVLLSTLLIRFSSAVEKATRGVIYKMQVEGDLPTRRERQEILRNLATLIEYNREDKP